MLELKDVHVFRGRKEIVKGVSLKIREGERHVLMGPNGSGKSTLALAIMGSPRYKVKGKVTFEGRDLTRLPPEERAREGIFLAFQHPPSIQGVRVYHFMRELKSRFGPFDEGLVKEFMDREVNVGFSGGEKKRFEIAQLLALKPKLAIIDEVDAGLDVDHHNPHRRSGKGDEGIEGSHHGGRKDREGGGKRVDKGSEEKGVRCA